MCTLAMQTRLAVGERLLGPLASSHRKTTKFESMTQKRLQQTAPKLDRRSQTIKKPEAKTSKSFCFNVFKGDLVAGQVFPYPEVLSDDDRVKLKQMVEQYSILGREVNDPLHYDEIEDVPVDVLKGFAEYGGFGVQVPKEYGGLGLNKTMAARLGQVGATFDLGLNILAGAHQSIGYKGILLVGSEEQKKKYVPSLASGEKLAAFALTEPGSGSDASSIRTRAVLNAEGTHFVLNGSKIWITNGGIADVFTVLCKTPVVDAETGAERDKMTALIVERDFGGVISGPPCHKMGIRCSNTTEVYFDNVMVPVENVLSEPGKGFKVAMRILNEGRFGMGAALSGTMEAVIRQAAEYTAARSEAGRPVREFSTIQEKLSSMTVLHYVTESLAYVVAANMDAGAEDYHLEAAVSKIFASEAAWNVVDEAIQIFGGRGVMRETGLEKRLRDLRVFRIFEGTNEILRLFVALTGLQFAGGHLRQMVENVTKNPLAHTDLLVREGKKRTLRVFGVHSSGGVDLEPLVHAELKSAARRIDKAIGDFGAGAEFLLRKCGKGVIDEQFRLKRVADCVIDLYASVCALSRASRSLRNSASSARHESMMALLWCDIAADRIADNLAAIDGKAAQVNFGRMKEIAQNVVNAGGVVQGHPLGV